MISFGTIFLELVFGHLDALPGPGEEIFTEEFAISCGGAVTSATAAAMAGMQAGMCSVLGEDLGSQVVIGHCATAGVDITPSMRISGPAAGITIVLNFAGDRGFVTHVPRLLGSRSAVTEGAPAASGLRLFDSDRRNSEMERWPVVLRERRPAWCYLHAGPAVPGFLRQARALGCKIMLDTALGDERDRGAIIECVRLADVFVPNADELLRLTGAGTLESAVAAARGWGTQLVVTSGEAGAVVVALDGTVTEVAEGVGQVKVRDRTGAGDNFAGAVIAALHGGASLVQAAAAGNSAGSRAVGQLGAVGEVSGASGAGWPFSVSTTVSGALAAGALAAGAREG
jgi:sugar/nucleoside kinase (ribokinase family)